MKVFILVSLLALSTSVFAKAYVGLVNVQKVLVEVNQGKAVLNKLKKEKDSKEKELKKEEEKIIKMQQDLQKKSALMNKDARNKEDARIREKILKIQQKATAYRNELQKLELKLKKPIIENVRNVIIDISKKENVDLTVESSTTPIIYAKEQTDLTNKVIADYNKKHK